MKMEYTPQHNLDRLELIESQFYPAATAFSQARAKDDRDAHMNKDFVAARELAVQRVNTVLDQWLDLKKMIGLATPLEPAQ